MTLNRHVGVHWQLAVRRHRNLSAVIAVGCLFLVRCGLMLLVVRLTERKLWLRRGARQRRQLSLRVRRRHRSRSGNLRSDRRRRRAAFDARRRRASAETSSSSLLILAALLRRAIACVEQFELVKHRDVLQGRQRGRRRLGSGAGRRCRSRRVDLDAGAECIAGLLRRTGDTGRAGSRLCSCSDLASAAAARR